MYITELSAGDKILLKLISGKYAYPELINGEITYRTSNINQKMKASYFIEGEGFIISNENKKIKMSFNSFDSRSCYGIAEVDYNAFQFIYLNEGETNADTVVPKKKLDFDLEEDIEFPHTAPAMQIYRKKIILFWSE